jgi:superfamily I DNA/RNA helicase
MRASEPRPSAPRLSAITVSTLAVPPEKPAKAHSGHPRSHEFGVFVRSEAQLERARAAVAEGGLAFKTLDEQVETTSGHVSICTMHLAKGLEFRAVVVMACDDEVIPLQRMCLPGAFLEQTS